MCPNRSFDAKRGAISWLEFSEPDTTIFYTYADSGLRGPQRKGFVGIKQNCTRGSEEYGLALHGHYSLAHFEAEW